MLTIPDDQYKDGLVTWVTTDDNNYDPTDGEIDSGPAEGEPSTHGPVAVAMVNRESVPIGCVTTFPLDSNLPNAAYEMYVFGTTVGMPSVHNRNAIANWAASHPVAAEWQLNFSNMMGVADPNGDTSNPTVSVPNAPGLVESQFYLVAYVCASDSTGTYWIGSGLNTIEIVSP